MGGDGSRELRPLGAPGEEAKSGPHLRPLDVGHGDRSGFVLIAWVGLQVRKIKRERRLKPS